MTVTHAGAPVVLHAQPAEAVTATVVDPAAAEGLKLVGLIAYVHVVAVGAACVTVTVWPAAVNVAVRAAPVFGLTVSVTVPLPAPLAGLIEIHAGAPLTFHEHP